tara:strand:- start:129 stop:413 length:285 start_codon:yes stop_codon:yes gene_type:complete
MKLVNFPTKYEKAAIYYAAMQVTLKKLGEVMDEYNLAQGESPTNFISEEDPEMANAVTQRGISEAQWVQAKYNALKVEYLSFFNIPTQQQGGQQ